MTPVVLKIISGVISTVGFSILFRLKPIHWLYAAIDGALACIFYFLLMDAFDTVFLPNLLAALVCAFVAEIFARIAKAPSTVFLLPGIITLIPGGTLYYSMSNLLNSNYTEAGQCLLLTAEVAIALGGGIIGASILRIVLFKLYDTLKEKTANR